MPSETVPTEAPPRRGRSVPPPSQFWISAQATWPSVLFEVPAPATWTGHLFTWTWRLAWNSFTKSGTVQTLSNWWDAQSVIASCGGTLHVSVTGPPNTSAQWTANIYGTNPSEADIAAYLTTKPDTNGRNAIFTRILQRESQSAHFAKDGLPKQSPDRGFGLCQLTNPAPTMEQCWNWQRNLDCGLDLFATKQNEAQTYLSAGGTRPFTTRQLHYETVARWNGGRYHVWNNTQGWIRNPAVLCDTETGNIGWDLTNGANKGKPERDLHNRDKANYRRLPTRNDNWGYFGICYADQLLANLKL